MSLVLVLLGAAAVGLAFERLGVPGGLIVGAKICAAAVSLDRGGPEVAVPDPVRTASFLVLGAAIGSTVTRDTLGSLGAALLPAVLAAALLIGAGVAIAFVLRALGLAPVGDVLATSPGALSAVTAAAAARGLGAPEVALFHTVRLLLVMLSLPVTLTLLRDG